MTLRGRGLPKCITEVMWTSDKYRNQSILGYLLLVFKYVLWPSRSLLFPLVIFIVPLGWNPLHWVHSHIQHALQLLCFIFIIKSVWDWSIHCGKKTPIWLNLLLHTVYIWYVKTVYRIYSPYFLCQTTNRPVRPKKNRIPATTDFHSDVPWFISAKLCLKLIRYT